MLFSYPNVWNTCLLIIRDLGYRLYLTGTDPTLASCAWNAERDGIKLRGDNPIELLGLVAIHEHIKPNDDVSYWWRIDGPNVVAELEAEFQTRLRSELESLGES